MAVAGNMTPCIKVVLRNDEIFIVGSSYAADSVLYSDVIPPGRCLGGINDAIDALKMGGMISVCSVDNEFLRLRERFECRK